MCGSDGAQEIWLRQVNELRAGARIKQEEALRALRTEHQRECTTIPRNTFAHILQLACDLHLHFPGVAQNVASLM